MRNKKGSNLGALIKLFSRKYFIPVSILSVFGDGAHAHHSHGDPQDVVVNHATNGNQVIFCLLSFWLLKNFFEFYYRTIEDIHIIHIIRIIHNK